MKRRMTLRMGLALAAAAMLMWSCSDDSTGNDWRDGGPDGTAVDGTVDGEVDAGPLPTACEQLGLPERPFTDAADSVTLYDPAADFTVTTRNGSWTLSENWSGCEIYLVVPDWPDQNNPAFGYAMWDDASDVEDLFDRSPLNVHYLFVSTESDRTDRLAALDALQIHIDTALGNMTADLQQWWLERVHYVTDEIPDIDGWLRNILLNPGWGVGIDRFQRIRYIGSFAAPNHYDPNQPWPFGHNISMAANEAVYYNFEADRQAYMDATPATVVELWDATPLAADGGGWFYVNADLPDSVDMAGFDTMELDLSLTCIGRGEFGYCPAWDYNVFFNACDTLDATVSQCGTRVAQWITTYHREGRWMHDISGLLPLFAAGGEHRFAMNIADPWEVTLRLRFSDQARPMAPSESTPLFQGGHTLNQTYNDNYPPLLVPVPADAQRVEIWATVTGHGMSANDNCAEFCNTDHHFMVNGTDNLLDFPIVGNQYGCMQQIPDGTVPNQYGTWWYGRAGWCPGKHVEYAVYDVTSQVTLGTDNTFEYQGFYLGNPYTGGASIQLASYLVIYR